MILAGIEFKTKKAVIERIKGIKNSYAPGDYVSSEDKEVLLDLIETHPKSTEIKGCGVEGFKVDYSPSGWGDICFWVKRTDGTEGFFSYQKCIDAGSRSSQIASAMRLAIKPQIDEFKEKTFWNKGSMPCPITGEPITFQSCHVDHAAPGTFEMLRRGFLLLQVSKKRIETIDGVELKANKGGVGQVFADSKLMDDWIEYHRKYARLRCVSVTANLVILRKSKQWIPLKA